MAALPALLPAQEPREPVQLLALTVRTFGLPRGTVEVLVTARADDGLAAIEVDCAGDTTRFDETGRATASETLRCTPDFERLPGPEVRAVAISTTGDRSGTEVQPLFHFDDPGIKPDPATTARARRRLVDKTYPERVGGQDDWAEAFVPVLTDGVPWWKRWSDSGARKPFDFQNACPGAVGISANGQVLRCWLSLHPNVRETIVWHDYLAPAPILHRKIKPRYIRDVRLSYDEWTEEMKIFLDQAFYWSWKYFDGGADFFPGEYIPEVLPNLLTWRDQDPDLTVFAHNLVWKLYLGTIAQSLALEIGNFVPWSIVTYTKADLQILFHSDLLIWTGSLNVGDLFTLYGYIPRIVSPAPSTTIFEFLLENDIIRPSAARSVGQFLQWGNRDLHLRHVQSIIGLCNPGIAICDELEYGDRSKAPVARLLSGWTYTEFLPPYLVKGPSGFVPGCHGMAALASQVLRAINIPVDVNYTMTVDGVPHSMQLGKTQHSTPFFWTIGATLSHGDDVYTSISQSTPAFTGAMLLLPLDVYEDWFFGDGVLGDQGYANVGRWAHVEVPLKTLSNDLLQRYCIDEQNGTAHADGEVAAFFYSESYGLYYYTAGELEALQLWDKLAVKAAALGYCGS